MDHKAPVSPHSLLMDIFEPPSTPDGMWYYRAMDTIAYFAREFAKESGESPDALHFDYVAMSEMLKRFVRDAWGVKHFDESVNRSLKGIDPSFAGKAMPIVRDELHNLGVRINSDNPRKTRVAAAFTLWMSTFRPVSVDCNTGFKDDQLLVQFCAAFTFHLSSCYLQAYGTVTYGSDAKDEETRIGHVVHDLLYRCLNLSPLEMLYGGMFRAA